MPVSREQFDADLNPFLTSVTALIAAIEAWIASHGDADFTTEDNAVKDAATNVAAELAKLAPPPPPPQPTP